MVQVRMLSDEWLSRYGLLENFNASVTCTRTGKWTTGVTAIALCTSCSRAKNKETDQLCKNCTSDQCLCFRYTDSTIPLLLSLDISSFYFLWLYSLVCGGPGWKPGLFVFSCEDSLMSCSTIFQSHRDQAPVSLVIASTFGSLCILFKNITQH